MQNAGRALPAPAEQTHSSPVETIAQGYLKAAGGDAHNALRRAIGDALADLAELERVRRRLLISPQTHAPSRHARAGHGRPQSSSTDAC